jgi:hypothetical protein
MMPLKSINNKFLFFIIIIQSNLAQVNADISNMQSQKIIIKVTNDKPNIMEKFDSEELLRQLELFESYRPDSFSDATRNPFNSKRYQFQDLKDFILK